MAKKNNHNEPDSELPNPEDWQHPEWSAPELSDFDPLPMEWDPTLITPFEDVPWLNPSTYTQDVLKEELPPPDPNLTAADAVAWMLEEIERTDYLNQRTAAYHIATRFGERFTYFNKQGNPASTLTY